MSFEWTQRPVTASGKERPEISRHGRFSRDGKLVIALAGMTLIAYCIVCAAGDCAHANSRPSRQSRDLSAIASVKKEGPCDQSERVSLAGFDPLFDASTASTGGTIVGVASWYNPYVELADSETASGEQYDRDKWTAAIQIDLRDAFGGVGFGKDYRAAYALVESGDKRMIVKINDVGPLRPGRVIDLDERAMRYFDETLLLGLVPDVKVTPLPGGDWMPGPIASDPVKTRSCGPREARRDTSSKSLSALESSEPQTARHQRLDAPIRRDQHRGAAPSPRNDASDEVDEGRARRSGAHHRREADLSEESISGENPVQLGAAVRGDRQARRVDAETRYLEKAGE
jgi:rare lipoprotein A